MMKTNRIVCGLFLTGLLWACSPSPASPSESGTSVAAGETPIVLNLPSQIPSYTIGPSSEPQENPAASPTPEVSPGEVTPGEVTPGQVTPGQVTPGQITPGKVGTPICNDSLFVQDVTIPDGTILKPGQDFKKTWRIKNSGFCAWTADYAIGFAYGEQMHGSATKIQKAVGPGGTVDITLNLRAPQNRCWYGSWWRLKTDRGDYFGDFVFVSIQVADDSNPNTPDVTICPGYVPPS
jgi:hypothetical protein